MRYEPLADPVIDFTWEREWRLRCDELTFDPSEVALVVPNLDWQGFIFDIWNSQQRLEAEAYSAVLDQLVIQQIDASCPWRVVPLAT